MSSDLNEGTGLGDASEYHGKYLPALVPPEVNALTIGEACEASDSTLYIVGRLFNVDSTLGDCSMLS